MPIYYRYIFSIFYRYFSLTITCAVMGSLVIKTSKIQSLLSLNLTTLSMVKFILHYMHQLTPFILAIACLIANSGVLKDIFKNRHWQNLYSCGISYKKSITPLFINTFVWFLISFYSTSTISPKMQLKLNEKLLKKKAFNPLLALQNQPIFNNMPHLQLETISEGKANIDHFCLLFKPPFIKTPLAFTTSHLQYADKGLFFSDITLMMPSTDAMESLKQYKMLHFYKKLHLCMYKVSSILTKRTNTDVLKCIPTHTLIRTPQLKAFKEISNRISLAMLTPCFSLLLFIYYKKPTKSTFCKASVLAILLMLSFFIAKSLTNAVLAIILNISMHTIIVLLAKASVKSRRPIENST